MAYQVRAVIERNGEVRDVLIAQYSKKKPSNFLLAFDKLEKIESKTNVLASTIITTGANYGKMLNRYTN